jgi:hypothetical protein
MFVDENDLASVAVRTFFVKPAETCDDHQIAGLNKAGCCTV